MPSFLPSRLAGFEINQSFELDAILYLKAFTNREEVLGFVQGNNWGSDFGFREKYSTLAKNICSEEILQEFTEKDIKYVYVGSYAPWGDGYINHDEFNKCPNIYQPVYSKDQVTIYEINI